MSDLLEFCEKTLADQIHLTAISPDKGRPTIGRDFGTNAAEAAVWAEQQNVAGMNVYYTVNRVRPWLHKKPEKADIAGYRFGHVDVDPPKGSAGWSPEEREEVYQRIMAASTPPSTVVWSGNGWQALWRLHGSDTSQQQLEAVNRGLIELLGGDKGTHNADRLLRLPGLVNYPTALKRGWGRTEQPGRIAISEDETTNRIEDLLAAFPAPVEKAHDRQSTPLSNVTRLTADDLGLPSDTYLRKVIEEPDGRDRSADVFHFACDALRQGFTAEQVAGVLLNPLNAISSHCFDQANPARAARRAIEKALGEEDVRTLARKHQVERERALAAGECDGPSDETKIWTLEAMLRDCILIEDGAQVADTKRLGYLLPPSDFRASAAASKMKVAVLGKNGSTRKVSRKVAEIWLEHPDRRSAATMTFKPGAPMITAAPSGQTALNTWRGFRFASPPTDWELRVAPFLEHVEWLWGKDADAFLDWLAHLAQRPGELPSIAWLHIAKRTGMGRNWIATILGRVFVGYTALAFNLSGTLRSGYNGLLSGKMLAVVDEIDEGSGNRKYQIQQELKQLVTEETRTINPKFGRQHVEWNACRWLIFSNSTTALPLEDDDRRFWVVQCHQGPKDGEYYSRLYGLKDDPAFIASVAAYLLQRNIANFKQGQRAPMTDAKAELLERTRPPEEQVLHDVVQRWPVDVISNEELQHLMGDDPLTGAGLRYALERAGITKVGVWKNTATAFSGRVRTTAYAVRNWESWKKATQSALRAEVARFDKSTKELYLYSDAYDLF